MMKLSRLIEAGPALKILGNMKFPPKVSYRIAKASNMIQPELAAYYVARGKLAESIGTKTEDGEGFTFTDESGKSFIEQMNALTDEEVNLNLPTITPDDLGDVSIEPDHLAALDGIIIKEAVK